MKQIKESDALGVILAPRKSMGPFTRQLESAVNFGPGFYEIDCQGEIPEKVRNTISSAIYRKGYSKPNAGEPLVRTYLRDGRLILEIEIWEPGPLG